MQFAPYDNDEFPISVRTSVQAQIYDSYNEHHTCISEKSALDKLDASEQNEKHIVNATKGEGSVPTPKGNKADDDLWVLKSMSFFQAEPRCFVYDHDFFEKVIYYADTEDVQFVNLFNKTHKFLKMTTRQLEDVVFVIERIVKDDLTEAPTIDQVMYLLESNAPPYPIVQAILNHWYQRSKLKGSILKLKEFPPDHADIRRDYIKRIASLKKQIRTPQQYIRKLHDELERIQIQRENAIALLERETEKRRENIVFVREMIRKIKNSPVSNVSLLLEPDLKDENNTYEEESDNLKRLNLPLGVLPEPPEEPAFLNWVQQQKP